MLKVVKVMVDRVDDSLATQGSLVQVFHLQAMVSLGDSVLLAVDPNALPEPF